MSKILQFPFRQTARGSRSIYQIIRMWLDRRNAEKQLQRLPARMLRDIGMQLRGYPICCPRTTKLPVAEHSGRFFS